MGKTLLATTSGNRGFIFDTDQGHLPAKMTQDIAKEDFLLCPTCENYFSILETYIATRLHNRLWDIRFAGQFSTHENAGGVTWKVCEQINPSVFRLFIYSIVWRCSISESRLHSGFKITNEENSILKRNLKEFLCANQNELLEKIKDHNLINLCPFVIYTSQTFKNKTSNTIYTSSFNRNPYVLHLNEYIVIFSFTETEDLNRFDFLVNNDELIKIGFFTEKFWTEGNERFLNETVDVTLKKAKAAGKTVYLDPKIKTM